MTILTKDAAPALCEVLADTVHTRVIRSEGRLLHDAHAHGDGDTESLLDVECRPHVEKNGPREERQNDVGRARPAWANGSVS
jgi:hypothetical protein